MQSAASSVLPQYLQKSLLFGVLVALALVFAGRLFAPAMSLISTTAAAVTLLAYGVIAALCPIRLHRRHPDILRWAIIFGLLAGIRQSGSPLSIHARRPCLCGFSRRTDCGDIH